jgi:hypothetical protein
MSPGFFCTVQIRTVPVHPRTLCLFGSFYKEPYGTYIVIIMLFGMLLDNILANNKRLYKFEFMVFTDFSLLTFHDI